jgi:hypothetical protein
MRLTLFISVALAIPSLGADPPTIEKLIEQMGSRSFQERERATKALKERGHIALPALRKALESKDEEVRRRAESLIPAMEIDEALLPKRVTLAAGPRSVTDTIREISKQTGYKMESNVNVKTSKPSPELKDATFWEAIEGLSIENSGQMIWEEYSKTLRFQPVTGRSPHVNLRGPFRLEATWFHEDRDVNFAEAGNPGDPKRSHQLTLSVSVRAEPRISFLQIRPAKVDEAIDADGKSLLDPVVQAEAPPMDPNRTPPAPPGTTAPGRGTFRGETLQTSDVRLKRAGETAKTAKIIRGTIPVKAVIIRKNVVVTSKVLESTGTSFRAGMESMQITRVTNQGGGSVEVQVLVPYQQNGRNDDWHTRFFLEDDAGNRFQENGRGTSSDGRQQWISMYYAPGFNKKFGPPTKLLFEDWVVHEHSIPFEFKDVKLP